MSTGHMNHRVNSDLCGPIIIRFIRWCELFILKVILCSGLLPGDDSCSEDASGSSSDDESLPLPAKRSTFPQLAFGSDETETDSVSLFWRFCFFYSSICSYLILCFNLMVSVCGCGKT